MNGALLRLKKGGAVPIGGSKLFGSPDVPPDFEWPAVKDSENCYDLDFLCQINCVDKAPYDGGHLLPRSGILYFFYDFAVSSGSIEDRNAARVVYSSQKNLEPLIMVDDSGKDCALCPKRGLSFAELNKGTEKPRLQMPLSTDVRDGYVTLFGIDSFSIEHGNIHFTDIGTLWFLIDEKNLELRDFSDVRVSIVPL